VWDDPGVQKPRKVRFSLPTRRAFSSLTDEEATAVVMRLDDIAARVPEAPVPFVRVTETAGLRVSYEVRAEDVCVWSIARFGP
jgi:hypothetical protein